MVDLVVACCSCLSYDSNFILPFQVVIGQNFTVPAYSKVSLLQQPTKQDSDEELEYADNNSDVETSRKWKCVIVCSNFLYTTSLYYFLILDWWQFCEAPLINRYLWMHVTKSFEPLATNRLTHTLLLSRIDIIFCFSFAIQETALFIISYCLYHEFFTSIKKILLPILLVLKSTMNEKLCYLA